MKKPNEKDIIKIFQKQLGNKKFVSEDVEVFSLGKTSFVTKIDTLVESTDVPSGMSIQDSVRKSVVACVSDFAVKGVKPSYGMVSVTIPRKFSQKKIKALASGLAKAAKEFQIKISGGYCGYNFVLFSTVKNQIMRINFIQPCKFEQILICRKPSYYKPLFALGSHFIKGCR